MDKIKRDALELATRSFHGRPAHEIVEAAEVFEAYLSGFAHDPASPNVDDDSVERGPVDAERQAYKSPMVTVKVGTEPQTHSIASALATKAHVMKGETTVDPGTVSGVVGFGSQTLQDYVDSPSTFRTMQYHLSKQGLSVEPGALYHGDIKP